MIRIVKCFIPGFIIALLLFGSGVPGCFALDDDANNGFWADYESHLRQVPVLMAKPTCIYVDLPEDFIKAHPAVTMVITVKSMTIMVAGDRKKAVFTGYHPSFRFNNKTMATYDLYVTDEPGIQTHEIKINTRHLRAGRNKIKASWISSSPNQFCVSGLCHFIIADMYFKEADSGESIVLQPMPGDESS